MGDLRQQIESDLEVILECLTDKTYNAISDLMFYHGNDVLVDFAFYIKEHDETISYVKILNSFLLAFDDKPPKKWVKSTNEEINVLLTEYTEREQLIKIFSK